MQLIDNGTLLLSLCFLQISIFLPNDLLLFHDPIQDAVFWYLLRILLTMTISQIFLVLTVLSFFRRTQFSCSVMSNSETPWTAAHQASLSITSSQSLLKLMSIESVIPSISSFVVPPSSCPKFFPASESFAMSQFFASSGQSIGASALAPVLPVNI